LAVASRPHRRQKPIPPALDRLLAQIAPPNLGKKPAVSVFQRRETGRSVTSVFLNRQRGTRF
jgi:hypothetical protein